jgi:hypothetical protein
LYCNLTLTCSKHDLHANKLGGHPEILTQKYLTQLLLWGGATRLADSQGLENFKCHRPFLLPSRQEANNLIRNNVNDFHSSRNLWDVGTIQRANFIVWQVGWGETFRGWQVALEGEEDGLSCLSVCHTNIHPPQTSYTHRHPTHSY